MHNFVRTNELLYQLATLINCNTYWAKKCTNKMDSYGGSVTLTYSTYPDYVQTSNHLALFFSSFWIKVLMRLDGRVLLFVGGGVDIKVVDVGKL